MLQGQGVCVWGASARRAQVVTATPDECILRNKGNGMRCVAARFIAAACGMQGVALRHARRCMLPERARSLLAVPLASAALHAIMIARLRTPGWSEGLACIPAAWLPVTCSSTRRAVLGRAGPGRHVRALLRQRWPFGKERDLLKEQATYIATDAMHHATGVMQQASCNRRHATGNTGGRRPNPKGRNLEQARKQTCRRIAPTLHGTPATRSGARASKSRPDGVRCVWPWRPPASRHHITAHRRDSCHRSS
jgi:hypothetical protein